MDIEAALERALDAYAWLLVCGVLLFLFAIARFYERTAHERSHYRLFLLPLGLFALAAGRYAWVGGLTGDAAGDLLLFAGGISLFALGYALSRLMMGRRA